MSASKRIRDVVLAGMALLVAIVLPRLFSSGFALSTLVSTALFISLALSYDLSVAHAGTVHLAPAAFFGLGAYASALLATRSELGFTSLILFSAGLMVPVAIFVGLPSFRLSDVTFAIATLAFALISELVVSNAVGITGGPLCIRGIPRPRFRLGGFEYVVHSTLQYYYLLLPLVLLTVIVYRLITTGRLGRAFVAVREDEIAASAVGVHPLRYKMLAFIVGAAMTGALGSFQAQYITVICPTELSLDLTIRLLIIIFVGGAGTLHGVVLGAVIFTALPELLRYLGRVNVTPVHQLMLFGIILLLVITYAPGGLIELLRASRVRLSRRPALQKN